MKTFRILARNLLPLAALAAPLSAVAQEEALSSLFSITGPYDISVEGLGLAEGSAPETLESVYIGGDVEKAYFYWGGRSTTPDATNESVTLQITGPGGFDTGVQNVTQDWFRDLDRTPIRWNYRADITDLLNATAGAGDYSFEFGGWADDLIGCGVQVVYADGTVGNQKVEIFGGFDYNYIGKPDEHGDIRAVQHMIDIDATWAKITFMANDSHWDRTNNPREEEFWYKQGVGTLTGSSGAQVEIVNNAHRGSWASFSEEDRVIADPGAIRHAKNFLEGVDGQDWDTYRTTLSLTPNVSTVLTLDSQSTDESYSTPSITVVSPAGETASDAEPIVYDVLETSDSKFIVGGEFVSSHGLPRRNIVRVHHDGTVDETFAPGSGFNGAVRSVAVRPDGKILVGGEFSTFNGKYAFRLALLNPDGSRDEDTTLATPEHNSVRWVGALPDGRMLIAGDFRTIADSSGTRERRIGIARLNSDGSLDEFFTTNSGTDGARVDEVVVQEDGKILISGEFDSYRDISRNGIARLNSDGTLDTSFDPGTGAPGGTMTGGVLPDGKLAFGGGFGQFAGLDAGGIAVLDQTGVRSGDFGGSPLAVDEVRSLAVRPIPSSGIPVIPENPGGGNQSDSSAVGGSRDDAEEAPGGIVTIFSRTLELGLDDGIYPQDVGIRFEINVPQNAVVRHASIQFTADSDSAGPALFQIGAVDTDDAEAFTGVDFDVTVRELLQTSVEWEPAVWSVGDTGGAQRTPDLTSLVQEIVSNPDWTTGNGIMFVISGTGLREAKAFEAGASLAPVLNVRYEAEGRITDGLKVLYTFEEGEGEIVNDQSGSGAPLPLLIERPNDAAWGAGTLNFTEANRASNGDDNTKLMPLTASDGEGGTVTSNEISLEAWVTPVSATQGGPARIMSFSLDQNNRNFSLLQDGAQFEARLRTTASNDNGSNPAVTGGAAGAELTHVVFTRSEVGIATLYVNGQPESTNFIGGDFSTWNPTYDFSVGNEFNIGTDWEGRDFQGKLHLAAVYGRALNADEVLSNFNAGPRDGGGADNTIGGGTGITHEWFTGISGTTVADLTGAESYPNSPDGEAILDRFASPVNVLDNFGQRIHGFVLPPTDGNYSFGVAGNDQAAVYLSSDEYPILPTEENRLAYHTGYTDPEDYSKYASQITDTPVYLEAGKRYYILAIAKEGVNSDNLSVGWKMPGEAEVATIEGEYLEPYVTPDITGALTYERWDDIAGASLASLYSDPAFPTAPDEIAEVTSSEAPTNVGDEFGMRLHGYVVPSQGGQYRFAIAADDNAELWISTDEDPSNSTKIAYHNGWTPSRTWDKYAEQESELITLSAGSRYYIAGLAKEADGGDNLAIGWYRVGNSSQFSVITSDNLAPWDGEAVGAGGGLTPLLSFEGEEGQITGSLFDTVNDGDASNGQYVAATGSGTASSSQYSENYVTFNFIVAEGGDYRIKTRCYATNGNQNSFYVNVADIASNHPVGHLWDISSGGGWKDDYVNDRAGSGNGLADPVVHNLQPGSVTVKVHVREKGARLDTIELEKVN